MSSHQDDDFVKIDDYVAQNDQDVETKEAGSTPPEVQTTMMRDEKNLCEIREQENRRARLAWIDEWTRKSKKMHDPQSEINAKNIGAEPVIKDVPLEQEKKETKTGSVEIKIIQEKFDLKREETKVETKLNWALRQILNTELFAVKDPVWTATYDIKTKTLTQTSIVLLPLLPELTEKDWIAACVGHTTSNVLVQAIGTTVDGHFFAKMSFTMVLDKGEKGLDLLLWTELVPRLNIMTNRLLKFPELDQDVVTCGKEKTLKIFLGDIGPTPFAQFDDYAHFIQRPIIVNFLKQFNDQFGTDYCLYVTATEGQDSGKLHMVRSRLKLPIEMRM